MIRIILTCILLSVGLVYSTDIALWEFETDTPGFVSSIDESVSGLSADVLSKQSTSVHVDKGVCCGAVYFPNSESDSDLNNLMLAVNDTDVLTGHANGGNGLNSLTIEIEFKVDIIKQSILVRKTESNTSEGYQVYMTSEGKVGFQIGDGVNSGNAVSRNPVTLGQWHRVKATWENRFVNYNTQIMLDGVVSRASTAIGALSNTTYPLTIGGLYRDPGNYGQFFSGMIRSLRISTDRPRILDAHGKCDPMEYIIPTGGHLESQSGFVSSEFIYETPKTPECHASTIEDLGNGELAASWFGGTCEGHTDAKIWYSRYNGIRWSQPIVMGEGPMLFPQRDTVFNPVLYKHSNGRLFLYYKIGELGGTGLNGYQRYSDDNGLTWSYEMAIPSDSKGPSKNKPVELDNGDIVSPTSGAYVEISNDNAMSWDRAGISNTNDYLGVIQPTILVYPGGKLQALFRTQENSIAQAYSFNYGQSWSNLSLSSLPNNNSGIDAVSLSDGRHLLVYNNSTASEGSWGGPRTPLNVAVTSDGTNWNMVLTLEDEDGEYSYPAVIQADDGLVHITYTWKRLRVKHVVIDPQEF
ncbi:MAG: exo-alpha-sialidase [Sedimentisphaeraceae bacterium JB056]